jgi:anaerobic nitric oxide reductase transcription regulator
VRELEHLVARSALKALAELARLGPRPRIVSLTAAHLDLQAAAVGGGDSRVCDASGTPSVLPSPSAAPADLRRSTDAHQRQCIEASLARHPGNWAAAARELGLHRANLVRLAKRLGLA